MIIISNQDIYVKSRYLIYAALFTALTSCYRDKKSNISQKEYTTTIHKPIINTFSDSLVLDKLDYGCTTMYSLKGSQQYENIFIQGSAHEEGKLISFMKIDGALQIFYSSDKDFETLNNTSFITKLSNDSYDIEIKTHIGRYYQGSDSTAGKGTIKIIRKKDQSIVVINFEGGTAC